MIKLLKVLCFLSEKKATLFWPTFFGALFFAALTASKDEVHTYKTTLYLNKNAVTSPVLQNASESTHKKILNDTLKKDNVIEAALTEAGLMTGQTDTDRAARVSAFKKNTSLTTPHDTMLQIYYKGPETNDMTDYLEAVSFAFIRETLSPERLRMEQKLATLAEQIQYYAGKERNARVRLERDRSEGATSQNTIASQFEVERAATQRKLAQADYDALLEEAKPLMSMSVTGGNDLLWPVEAPMKLASLSKEELVLGNALVGAIIGLLISLGLIIWNSAKHTTITRDEDVLAKLGVRVLGRIPNLGHIHVDQGQMSIDTKTRQAK